MSRRPTPSGPFSPAALATYAGMATFITGVSVYPRLTLDRSDTFTTLRYQHRQSTSSGIPPTDPGLVIAPGPMNVSRSSAKSGGRFWSDQDWILDTGATTHVCTDAGVMHRYTSFAHTSLSNNVAHFGPSSISIAGIGDCTVEVPGGQSGTAKGKMTIRDVRHIPTAGINIISWSQLKRARGLDLKLRDNEDGSLGVVSGKGEGGREVLRFVLRDGLYFLERGREV